MGDAEDAVLRISSNYGEKAVMQNTAVLYCVDIIKGALVDMERKQPSRFADSSKPFHIADLGSADGVNFVPILKMIIRFCREKNPSLPIKFSVQDLPGSDITKLLKTVNAGVEEMDNVFVYCHARSFYEALFPANDVDIFLCGSSIHYLTKVPMPVEKFCGAALPEICDDEDGKIWVAQAKEDLQSFMLHRQKELKSFGRMIMWARVCNENTSTCVIQLIKYYADAYNNILRNHNLGHLIPKMILPSYVRNEKQILQIFEHPAVTLRKLDYHEFMPLKPPPVTFENDAEYNQHLANISASSSTVLMGFYDSKLQFAGVPKDLIKEILAEFRESQISIIKNDFLSKGPSAMIPFFLLHVEKPE